MQLEGSPHSLQLEKAENWCTALKTVLPKINKINSNDFISAFRVKKKKSPNDFIHNDRRKEKMRL